MKPLRLLVALPFFSALGASVQAQSAHVMVHPDSIRWSPARNGISSAVLDGQPSTSGAVYTLALKLSDGAWIPPHWHPNDKRVAVIRGTLLMGMGDSLVHAAASEVRAGGLVVVPANSRHYEGARGETVLFLYGIGPLVTNFVQPPR